LAEKDPMNLNTVRSMLRPGSADEITAWRDGYAWLAGGTWLFSEPQVATDTLIDLEQLGWPALEMVPDGLDIAATCRIAELYGFPAPSHWTAAPLIRSCCNALLASFKIWNAATVGGNICMSLPAGAMISLTVALEGVYTLWPRDGAPRQVAAIDFVIGNNVNVLRPGDLLRAIHLPATALRKRVAFRQSSLTHLGRSAALLIGTRSLDADDLVITISATTPRPVRLLFPSTPSPKALRQAIDGRISADGYFSDVHGSAAYKRHLTYHFAEDIRAELAAPGDEG
jgi:CO/xanthine dehydrogenase FAD-binding subunit